MKEDRLDCCVVRDLLPGYIEELTEPETARQVRAHLEHCPDCRQREADMRRALPIEKAPRRALGFLKRVRRARLVAAALSAALALACMGWLYDTAYHYPNTEAGRLAALEEYLPDARDTDKGVAPGTPLEVVGWQERGKYLYLFYMADNDQNMHGVVTLEKGWNGKYQPFTAEIEPSNRWGGLYGGQILAGKEGEWLFYLAGYNCREVYSATLDFYLSDQNGEGLGVTTLHLPQMDGEDFFWLWNWEELAGQLGLSQGEAARARLGDVRLYDKAGQEISQTFIEGEEPHWGSGKSTAERFLLYVYMALAGLMGLVLVRYFLRRD